MSRRALLGGLASFASVLALGGCADVDAAGARFDASSFSLDPTLLVTTTRKPVNGGRAKPWFGPERASTMTIARAKVVPPDDGRFSLAAVGLADYLRAYEGVSDARASIGRYLDFYNGRRPHSGLDGITPDHAYFRPLPLRLAA